ncbi:MAG TPA: hypothetical protein VG843_06965 [Rhizomicrobium sp.]|jgi:hypothetical protein|nr:hypothetical protein [Rhizomicrobium sp.]
MIFRAIFWIGLVAVMMPREPDLGFGRPSPLDRPADPALASLGQDYASRGAAGAEALCGPGAKTCADAVSIVDEFRSMTLARLAKVKADIEAGDRRRRD